MNQPFKPLSSDSPPRLSSRTVVLQPLPGIGDMIWHLPALQAIAATDPSGSIDLVIHEKLPARSLLESENLVGCYFPLPMGRSLSSRLLALKFLIGALRRQNYQRAFLFHPSDRYALAFGLSGIPQIYGFGGGLQNMVLQKHAILPEADRKAFILERSLNLVKRAGLSVAAPLPALHPRPETVDKIQKAFAVFPHPWAAIAIGSQEAKRVWPPERFAAVIDALWKAGHRSLFLLGAPHEAPQGEKIIAHCRVARPLLCTQSPLEDVIALIAQCTFAFGTDSGLTNIAAAVNVPAYVMFATVQPRDYSPCLFPITPAEGIRPDGSVSDISVERCIAALQPLGAFRIAPDPTRNDEK
jgi:heptosyltransferase-2